MRTLFITLCLANIAFLFGTLPWWPKEGTSNELAIHLTIAVLICFGFGFMAAIFLGGSWLMTIASPTDFCVPNREYWTNKENLPQTIRRIRFSFELMGVLLLFFVLILQWELFQFLRAASPDRNPVVLWFADGILVAWFTGGILVAAVIFENLRLIWSFRLPKEKRQLDESAISTTMAPNEKPKGDDQ